MRRLQAVLLCCALIAVGVMAGCGKVKEATRAAKNLGQAAKVAKGGKGTFTDEKGEKVEVSGDEGTMTIKTEEGEMKIKSGKDDADLSGLGIEVYPGAKVEGSSKVTHPEGDAHNASLTTNDPFDKVAKFYKSKYPNARTNEMTSDDDKMVMLHISDPPNMKMVTVVDDKDEDGVQIMLMRQSEKKSD